MPPVTAAAEMLTVEDYRATPEGARYQLVEGSLYLMSPSPRFTHQAIVWNLVGILSRYLERHPVGRAFVAPFDVFLSDNDVVQPDVFFVANDRLKALQDDGVHGAPDLVIEVLGKLKDKTTATNQLWQTDFTYLKVTGWGWFYLSTVLDDFSRYIIAGKLCTTMKAQDVTDTLDLALTASGCDQARVVHKPRLLSDNGSSYVSGELADWLNAQNMGHVRGAPYHPQTQGKIERWHQTLKNRILLENYYLPGDLEASIDRFVDHYNHRRYHESLSNLTPADVYFGRGQTILLERERIKRNTIQKRRLQHRKKAA